MADVTYAMQQVTKKGGTAPQVSSIGYPVAGKTGTSSDNKSAWFVGFTRQLVTAVALYQSDDAGNAVSITPFGGYTEITGGSVPADLWTTYMKQAMAGREKVDFPPPAYVGTPNVPPTVQVPDVTGMTEADARTALGTVGLTSTVAQANDPKVPQGQVISSDPAAGTDVDQGSAVTITVSLGPGTVAVPDVVGLAEADATALLTSLGLNPSSVQAPSDTVPAGSVDLGRPGGGHVRSRPATRCSSRCRAARRPRPRARPRVRVRRCRCRRRPCRTRCSDARRRQRQGRRLTVSWAGAWTASGSPARAARMVGRCPALGADHRGPASCGAGRAD